LRIEISFLNRNYLKKSSEIQKAFKMAKENIEQTYFEKCVLMAVEDINQDYETGTSGIAESEYKALIHGSEIIGFSTIRNVLWMTICPAFDRAHQMRITDAAGMKSSESCDGSVSGKVGAEK
jgi:hypothetical protein